MRSTIDSINNRVVPALSLESADESWQSTLRGSVLCRPVLGAFDAISRSLSSLSSIGNLMQMGGFLLVLLLFLVLAAPQFANDKNVLALVVCAALGLRAAGALMGGREPYKPTAVDAVVLAYLASNVVSTCASHYLRESIHGLAKLVVYIFSYFLFTNVLQYRSNKRILGVIAALTTGAIAVSLYGLYQYKMGVAPLATWEDPTIEDKATRVFSTLGNPNLLAGYLVPIIPLSLALALSAICSPALKSARWVAGLALLGIAGIIAVTTVLTGSRGAYIAIILEAMVVGFVSFTWTWRSFPRARLPMLLALVAAPIAAVLLVHFALPSFEHRFMSIFSGTEHSSNAYRMNVWKASFAMFKENWWLGIGTGNKTFELAYGLYMRSGFDALGTYCVPLEVAVETGVPGLLIFLWLLVACVARAHSRFWSTQDAVTRWICVGAAAAIVGMMAHGLVDTVFLRPQVQFIFWLAISILVALPVVKAEQPS